MTRDPRPANLMRPFTWDPGCRVLEIGAGDGAITHFLGQTFTKVTAVEHRSDRAEVAAQLTSGMDHVSVVSASAASLTPAGSFDVVCALGTLDECPADTGDGSLLIRVLRWLKGHLDATGTLVLAVDNKFGLRYFSGMADDHTGRPFDGIEGYPRDGDQQVRAVARTELVDAMVQAGFGAHTFFYPFPDHHAPRVVVSEKGLESGGHQIAEFIGRPARGIHSNVAQPHFDHGAAWHEVLVNRMGQDLSNSFLVMASVGDAVHHVAAEWDAVSYNLFPRRPEYWSESKVLEVAGAHARIVRSRVNPELPVQAGTGMPDSFEEPWTPGRTVHEAASQEASSDTADYPSVAEALRPWFDFLRAQADSTGFLPGHLVDAIPQNMIMDGSRVRAIDQEFFHDEPLPMAYVITRGLVIFFTKVRGANRERLQLRRLSLFRKIQRVCHAVGTSYERRDVVDYTERESRFLATVNVEAPSADELMALLMLPPRAVGPARSAIQRTHRVRQRINQSPRRV